MAPARCGWSQPLYHLYRAAKARSAARRLRGVRVYERRRGAGCGAALCSLAVPGLSVAEVVAVAEVNFEAAAIGYAARGWACHPLALDDNGFAKRAIVPGWEKLTPADALGLDWSHALGIGLIGGANSGNLAFIDIDDEELAVETATHLLEIKIYVQMAWTARGRLHVYVQEPKPSLTRKLTLSWKERAVKVELRASGAYVAAPPSPRYQWVDDSMQKPWESTLSDAWLRIARELHVTFARPEQQQGGPSGAGYPSGWAKTIPHGERNDACFYEASCLKDGRVPMEQGWGFMQVRINSAYQAPIDWRELRRTFESAYRRPVSEHRNGSADTFVTSKVRASWD